MSRILAKHCNPEHKAASRIVGYALTLGGYDAWNAASLVWEARLTPTERGAMAFAALNSLDNENALVVRDARFGGAGMPQAALFSEMDQASHWADMASAEEKDAYALASFSRMSPARQSAFLAYVSGRAAA